MPKLTPLITLLLMSSPVWAQGEKYFPAKKGAKWTYKTNGPDLVMTVTETKKFGDQEAWKVETQKAGNKELLGFEHVAVKSDGLYRYAIDGAVINPPVQFLKLPFMADEIYPVQEWIVGDQQPPLRGTFTSGKKETVKFKDKDYEALTVLWKSADNKLTMKYYFVEDLGMVKQILTVDNGAESVLELKDLSGVK